MYRRVRRGGIHIGKGSYRSNETKGLTRQKVTPNQTIVI